MLLNLESVERKGKNTEVSIFWEQKELFIAFKGYHFMKKNKQ